MVFFTLAKLIKRVCYPNGFTVGKNSNLFFDKFDVAVANRRTFMFFFS